MIFLIACILELVICIVSIFIPTVYTQDYSWVKIKDVFSNYKKAGSSQLTLLSYFDYFYIIIISLVVLVMIVYLICYFTKNSDVIPEFVLDIAFALPIVLMIVAAIKSATSDTVGGSGIYGGTGTSSGLTVYGWLLFVAFVAVLILINIGLGLQRKKLAEEKETTVKELKIKEKPGKDSDIAPDDWK